MVAQTKLRVLDPVSEAVVEDASKALRLESLNGKTIGLYSNQKLNATKLLDMVEGVLGEQFQLKGVVRGTYSAARVLRPEEWTGVEDCDAIILTHGD